MNGLTSKTLFRVFGLGCLLICCTGCLQDERTTVTLVLQGERRLGEQIAEHLAPTLVDVAGRVNMSSWREGERDVHLTLSPVKNPDDLRQRVWFGRVTKIEGRTVYIEVDYLRGAFSVISTRVKKIFADLWYDSEWE